jgi:hypothetical protein
MHLGKISLQRFNADIRVIAQVAVQRSGARTWLANLRINSADQLESAVMVKAATHSSGTRE